MGRELAFQLYFLAQLQNHLWLLFFCLFSSKEWEYTPLSVQKLSSAIYEVLRKKTEFHLDLSLFGLFFLQQKVIYYLCILLKDPVEPHGISQVVPIFQVSTEDFS